MLDATPRGAPANLWRTRRPFVLLFGAALLVVARCHRDRQGLAAARLLLGHSRERAARLRALPAGVRAPGAAGARARDPALHRRRRLARRPPPPVDARARARLRRRRLHGAPAGDAAGRLLQPALRGRAREGPLPVLRRARSSCSALPPRSGRGSGRAGGRWSSRRASRPSASRPRRSPLYEKFNVDSPVAILNNELLELATSTRWAHVLLVLAALVAAQALLLAKAFVPWRAAVVAVAALATLALPLETVYAFDRLFAVNGTNGLPVTLDQGIVFNWVDRNVGPTGRVTVMKYPVGGPDWWAGQGYWWDVEFWNESAVETMADMSLKRAKHWRESFDPRTGRRARRAGDAVRVLLRRRRAFPARRQVDRLRPRGLRVRHRAAVARGLAHRRHLSRRLDAAAPARDDHGLRRAGPEDGAAAFPDDRVARRPTRSSRGL